MKKVVILLLFCSFVSAFAQSGKPQTRPRRVGPAPSQTQSPQTDSTPEVQTNDSSTSVRPTRPPVLGGATRSPGESNGQQPATAQKDAGPEEVGEGDVVRVDTTLVSIPVSVMDRDGKYIPDLRKEDFTIWEDGVQQRVAYFASVEKPFTVALVIDTSGSTRFRLQEIQDAAIAFVNQLRPEDRVLVVSFSDKVRVLSQVTNDRMRLRDAILRTEPGAGTRLYDAVDSVINEHFSRIEGRKAIVLFTDGVDTTSKHGTYESTLRDAEELDALVYPVEYNTFGDMGIWGPGGGGGGWPGGGRSSGNVIIDILGGILGGGNNNGNYPGNNNPNNYPRGGRRGGGGRWPGSGGPSGTGTSSEEYERGDRYLNDLARVTGARLYNADQQNLNSAFEMVAEELRRQYSLGFYPNRKPQVGERRSLRVRVDRPELVVRTRDSYIFGQQNGSKTAQGQPVPQPPVLKK